MPSPLERLLVALTLPELRRTARAYQLELDAGATRPRLTADLLALPQVDPAEVVGHVLRKEELPRLARALGLSGQGTGRQLAARLARALRYVSFEEASSRARALGISSVRQWRRWFKANRPTDLPFGPDLSYQGLGWTSWGDFLGTGRSSVRRRKYRSFEKGRAFVHRLGLESSSDWNAWCQGRRPDLPARPADIPTNPHRTYKGKWKGMGDWLGTGTVQTQQRVYRPFRAAKALVQSLGLESQREYFAWQRAQARSPAGTDLPAQPQLVYADEWEGWGDFLGTGAVAPSRRRFRGFRPARAFVHGLGLKSLEDWYAWCGQRDRPLDIPTNPQRTYRGKGWISFGDWLGTGTLATRLRTYWPFPRARRFARRLGLRSQGEWRRWCQGKLVHPLSKPPEMPANPWRTYAADWAGWKDWLGND